MTDTLTTAELVALDAGEGTDLWRQLREGAITSSRIAAVLGLSPWESPFSLWHRMAGLVDEQPVNDLMHWGAKLEPLILDEYALRRSVVGCALKVKPGLFRHRNRTWQMATPDALNGDRIVETKYSPMMDGWGDEGTDQIPVYYRAQVQWQMDVFGFSFADIAVFFGGSGEYREYVVEYDPEDIHVMRDRALDFLDSLDCGRRPSIDGHDQTYTVVREMHPDIDDEKVTIPDDIGDEYRSALAWLDSAELAKQAAAGKVLDAMGRGRRAIHRGEQIAMRIPGRNGKPPYLKQTIAKKAGQTVRAEQASRGTS